MANDDWAVVVGVRLYPDLGNLDGPENDARAFHDWLLSPQGGAVPSEQIALILSSDYDPAPVPSRAEPTTLRVQQAFEDLQDVAEHNAAAGNGRRVGRRLYIYLSGHGCAPRLNDSALLTANATKLRPGYHILGKLYADWFLRSNFFDQAILFMDCCRESYPQAPPNIPPYIDVTGPMLWTKPAPFTASARSGHVSLASASWPTAFRMASSPGPFSPVLRGEACDPNSGQITAATLGNYLYNHMKVFLTADDLADPDVPKEPDLQYDQTPANPIVFTTVTVPQYPVIINLPAAIAGQQVQILSDKLQPVAAAAANPPTWQLQLKPGTYLAQVLGAGLQTPAFEVGGTGAVNVSF